MSLLEKLQASITAVAETLEITADEAAATAARLPSLLRVKPETIRGTLAALLRIPELEPVALALCRQNPNTLFRDPLKIVTKWESLQYLTAQQPEWHLEWRRWPQQLGVVNNLFSYSLRSHQRLSYLSDSCNCGKGLAGSRRANSWLQMPASRFEKLCPGYQQWLERPE